MEEFGADVIPGDARKFNINMKEFVLANKNPNSVHKTQSDVKKFTDYQHRITEQRSLKQIAASKLHIYRYMDRFFMTINNK